MKARMIPALFTVVAVLAACSDAPADDMAQAMGEAVEDVASRFQQDARTAMQEARLAADGLEASYAEATGDAAAAWQRTRMEIAEYRSRIEGDLARLGSASEEQAAMIRDEITADVAALTARVEHARLQAAEGGEAFVEASRTSLEAVEEDLAQLRAETGGLAEAARVETEGAIDSLDRQADELLTEIDALAEAAEGEIAEQRDVIAQRIGELTASVQRELLELRSDVTT